MTSHPHFMNDSELVLEFQQAVQDLPGSGAAGRKRHKQAVDELLERLERAKKDVNMNNDQAVGYMLLACKDAGFTGKQARKLYGSMSYMFDTKTEEEAEDQGKKWYYDQDRDE